MHRRTEGETLSKRLPTWWRQLGQLRFFSEHTSLSQQSICHLATAENTRKYTKSSATAETPERDTPLALNAPDGGIPLGQSP